VKFRRHDLDQQPKGKISEQLSKPDLDYYKREKEHDYDRIK